MMEPGGLSEKLSAGSEGGGSAGGGGSTWSLMVGDALRFPMPVVVEGEDGPRGRQSANETEGVRGGFAGTGSPE